MCSVTSRDLTNHSDYRWHGCVQGVTEVLCEACDLLGWKTPTKIQIEAIPVALEGEMIDLL